MRCYACCTFAGPAKQFTQMELSLAYHRIHSRCRANGVSFKVSSGALDITAWRRGSEHVANELCYYSAMLSVLRSNHKVLHKD